MTAATIDAGHYSAEQLRRSASPAERWFVAAVMLLTVVLIRFLNGSDDTTAGSPVAQVIWGLVYLGSIAGLVASRQTFMTLLRRSPLIVLVIALAVFSCLWSVDPFLSARRVIGLIGSTAFAYYVVARLELVDFLDVFAIIVAVASLLSIIVIALDPTVGLMQDEYVGAWRGIFSHKNALGPFMALGIVTLLAVRWRVSRLRAVAIGTTLTVCLVLLIGSQSVTALIVAASCAFAMALSAIARLGAVGRMAAVVLVCLAVAVPAVAALLGFDLGQQFLALVGRDESLTGRTDIWPAVVTAISDRPLLGYGYDVFWEPGGVFTQYVPHSAGWRPYHAHNGYLELCLDLGLVGFGLWIVTMGYGFVRSFRYLGRGLTRQRSWVLVILVYFLALNFSESTIAKYNEFGWILFVVAFLYATTAVDRTRSEREFLPDVAFGERANS